MRGHGQFGEPLPREHCFCRSAERLMLADSRTSPYVCCQCGITMAEVKGPCYGPKP